MRRASALTLAVLVAACGVTGPAPTSDPTPRRQADWQAHEIATAKAVISLPSDWLALGETELSDAAVRSSLEAEFAGARGLFRAVSAQGSRVRLVFLGVDPAGRGRPELTPTVAVVAVEPRIPSIGLGLGADFVLDALDGALSIETEIERATEPDPAVSEAVRFGFEHRVADRDGESGRRAALEGALVTTDASSFLVLLNVDATTPTAGATLDDVLETLRVLR